jgi:hypothetical protein
MGKAVVVRPKIPMDQAAAILSEMCDVVEDAEQNPDFDLKGAAAAAVRQAFRDAEVDLADAVDRRIAWLAYVDGQIIAARAARDGWDAHKQRLESLLEAMKDATAAVVREHKTEEKALAFRGRLGQLAVQTNGGVLPLELTLPMGDLLAETIEEYAIDERFYRMSVTYTLDKEAIRAALEAGEKLPWAKLGERGSHLRVKRAALEATS